MHRGTWWLLGVLPVLVFAVLVFMLARGWGTPPPLDISYDRIAKVHVVPEGSNPPPIVRLPTERWERPLAVVRSDIPSPFPAPAGCQFWDVGTHGVQLSVWLTDGRQLDYRGCAFPGELEQLYHDAWSWPGTG